MIRSLLYAVALGVSLIGAAHAATLDEIKARGSIMVGVEAKNPPGVYRDGNEIVGYDVDIAKYVAEKLGVKLELIDTDWDGIIPSLISGKFDTIISGMSITTDRLKKVNYSNPYNAGASSFLVYADSGIVTARDMSGKRLGVPIGSFVVKPLEAFNAKLQAEGVQPIILETYNSLTDVLTDLVNKRVDAAIERPVTFHLWEKTTGQDAGKFSIVPDLSEIISTINVHGAAVPKGNDSLLAFINATLDEMRANGKLEELQVKWLAGRVEVPATIPDNIP